ncbi:MAG: hypothetical protein KBF62_00870 [Candidatus Pacebacteria bacterium]|nr:hypothetical protein [Candidatus Paceibacterota bacterium]MBP9058173.1 hypothetical protein [Candidatus Paceibacterota bacterium]MBP9769909.1 hypothetical protein [Candidatus Paceibacterota bacterium]
MEFYWYLIIGLLLILLAIFVRRKSLTAGIDFAEDEPPYIVSKSFRVRFWGSFIIFWLPFMFFIAGIVFVVIGILKLVN